MNELSKVFTALDIDMKEVTKAAATKWNFLPFHPGLVGGHCIGVDPYYLIHRSMQAGYEPTLLKSARVINNSMGDYVASRMLALLAKKDITASTARVLIMGIAFKENTADIRNSRVVELINQLIASWALWAGKRVWWRMRYVCWRVKCKIPTVATLLINFSVLYFFLGNL